MDIERQSIIVPFYIPILDIIISHNLHIDIVDHSVESTEENKSRVICGGNIRKYRVNGDVKDYNIIIEMENDSLYHVRKRGIMMRTNVGEDLRKHIIKTMVKYVDEGGKNGARGGETRETRELEWLSALVPGGKAPGGQHQEARLRESEQQQQQQQ